MHLLALALAAVSVLPLAGGCATAVPEHLVPAHSARVRSEVSEADPAADVAALIERVREGTGVTALACPADAEEHLDVHVGASDATSYTERFCLDGEGRRHGPYTRHLMERSARIMEGSYRHGRKHGTWAYWSTAGRLELELYEDGRKLRLERRVEGGGGGAE